MCCKFRHHRNVWRYLNSYTHWYELFKTTWGRQAPECDHISRCYILDLNISSVSCPVSRSKHLCIWELIMGHNRSLYMGHRMSIGLLPGTQLLFLVLLFRLALSDTQKIQQEAVLLHSHKQVWQLNILQMTQAGYRQGACHDPQHWWIKSQYIYTTH